MLSVTAINNAKPKDKPYKLADEKGLYLLVQATGGKLWRLDYRFDAKRKTLALGSYPDVSLTDEAIVCEARENWHPDKLKIPREKFFLAIDWMRDKQIVPEGKGKKVLAKGKK